MAKTSTKDLLIKVGEELFGSHGYSGVKLNKILDLVGIPKGSFYHCFNSKEDFAAQTINDFITGKESDIVALNKKQVNPLEMLQFLYLSKNNEKKRGSSTIGSVVGNLLAESDHAKPFLKKALTDTHDIWLNKLKNIFIQEQATVHFSKVLVPKHMARVFWAHWQGALLRSHSSSSSNELEQSLNECLDLFA